MRVRWPEGSTERAWIEVGIRLRWAMMRDLRCARGMRLRSAPMGENHEPDWEQTLADLSPDELAAYLTQLQANLDRALDRSADYRRRIEKLEQDRETLRRRLSEARASRRRLGATLLPRGRSRTPDDDVTEDGSAAPDDAASGAAASTPRRDLTVATILDPISEAVFQPEFRSRPLDASDGPAQLDELGSPDFLLVESGFTGRHGTWAHRVAHFGAPHPDLVAVVGGARARGIPTVFWNKEDPINYGMFIGSASLFDHVFTVDRNVIDRYRSDLGHNRIHLLPFAAQPDLHFPPASDAERIPVLPGHDQPKRRPVLVGQLPSVHSRHQQAQRVHGLVDAQALPVGPLQDGTLLARHLLRVMQRFEGHVTCARGWLEALQDVGQGNADPGDHHRPRLDTAQSIDALLQRVRSEQVLERNGAGFGDLAFDRDRPGSRPQAMGVAGRILLVGPELVEVVVAASSGQPTEPKDRI